MLNESVSLKLYQIEQICLFFSWYQEQHLEVLYMNVLLMNCLEYIVSPLFNKGKYKIVQVATHLKKSVIFPG